MFAIAMVSTVLLVSNADVPTFADKPKVPKAFQNSVTTINPNMDSSRPYKLLLEGTIASIQTYEEGHMQFMLSGPFKLMVKGGDNAKTRIDSTFTMVAIDGTHYHKMSLRDFKLLSMTQTEITGTVDLYGIHGDEEPFVVGEDAPVTIHVLNGVVFTIDIDSDAIGGHFGTGPIYGEITKLKQRGI